MLVLILKVAGHFLTIAENSQSVTVTKQSVAGTQHVARLRTVIWTVARLTVLPCPRATGSLETVLGMCRVLQQLAW